MYIHKCMCRRASYDFYHARGTHGGALQKGALAKLATLATHCKDTVELHHAQLLSSASTPTAHRRTAVIPSPSVPSQPRKAARRITTGARVSGHIQCYMCPHRALCVFILNYIVLRTETGRRLSALPVATSKTSATTSPTFKRSAQTARHFQRAALPRGREGGRTPPQKK
jgi:hypothetical protein